MTSLYTYKHYIISLFNSNHRFYVVLDQYLDMSTSNECPECGREFKRVGSHIDSLNCISNQHRDKIQEESLRRIPNSEKAVEWMKQSDFRLEELYKNTSGSSYKKRHYTSEQGLKALERNIFVNASYNGIRAEIKSKSEEYITCLVTGDTLMFSDVIVVVPDTETDLSRRRVIYLKKILTDEPHLAFTTDGDRVGEVYNSEDAVETVPECKPDVFATKI